MPLPASLSHPQITQSTPIESPRKQKCTQAHSPSMRMESVSIPQARPYHHQDYHHQDAQDDDNSAKGILRKVPCLSCAQSSWVIADDGYPIGPQPCCRPRAGLKCTRCTLFDKPCLPIPGPFVAEIVRLRQEPDDDSDPVAATRSWTRRVQRFLHTANKEPEMLRLMRSLLDHTFELRNDIRQAYNIGTRLPESAKIVWPIMDGTENEESSTESEEEPTET
ncbi:hypothetical protein BJX63DRAFT_429863 [Aspergillus granulosus]|uniref:Zn(2)-C6 fungal-type domain-containing protein n=1 Tax=Aspergillus granulosus TaxID=176169 RepID=A0ABR4HNT1_9EURO